MSSNRSRASAGVKGKECTKKSLLDVAEELFSEKGFAETSLRSITTKAGVNLASVNYHFGSKKSLIQAVFARFLTPFCQALELELKKYETGLEHESADLEHLLRILTQTALLTTQNQTNGPRIFMRLLGLAYTQGQGHLRRFLTREYGAVFAAFTRLITDATPQLSEQERFWRIHFALGSTIFALSGAESLTAMAEHDLGQASGMEQLVDEMIPFLVAGLHS